MKHRIDLTNPIAQLPYLGMPVDEFVALAEADGWTVHVSWEHPRCLRDNVITMEVKHNWVYCRERGGRVVHLNGCA